VETFLDRDERRARSNGVSAGPDRVGSYLDELAGRLHGSPHHARRVLVEAEAHLADAIEANLRAGMDPDAAEAAALSVFGTAAEVASAVNTAGWPRARRSALRDAARLLLRLTAAGMIVIGLAGGAARGLAALTSTGTVFGLPAGARPSAASCAHWLAVQPTAHSCQQAGTLEASSDLTMVMGAVGVLGVLLLALVVLTDRRFPVPRVLPSVLGPAIGASAFGAAAVGLAVLAANDTVLFAAWGSGLWATDAAVSLLAALACGWLLLRAVSRTYAMAGPARS
jgi:hypothetical protein